MGSPHPRQPDSCRAAWDDYLLRKVLPLNLNSFGPFGVSTVWMLVDWKIILPGGFFRGVAVVGRLTLDFSLMLLYSQAIRNPAAKGCICCSRPQMKQCLILLDEFLVGFHLFQLR